MTTHAPQKTVPPVKTCCEYPGRFHTKKCPVTVRRRERNAEKRAQSALGRVGRIRADSKAYWERNHFIALLAAMYPSKTYVDPEKPGKIVISIETPTGQMAWHVHQAHRKTLFSHVPNGTAEYDGHSTKEKYRRMQSLTEQIAQGIK